MPAGLNSQQMKTLRIISVFLTGLFLLNACNDENETDLQKPEINLDITDAFPQNCDTLYFGETFTFKAQFTDNFELGTDNAFSINIHNNFDHHSHSTEVTECVPEAAKDAVNPFSFIESYSIPEGTRDYETAITIDLTEGDSNGVFDDGDYHFFISLTDKEGWSAQKGLSIKILHR